MSQIYGIHLGTEGNHIHQVKLMWKFPDPGNSSQGIPGNLKEVAGAFQGIVTECQGIPRQFPDPGMPREVPGTFRETSEDFMAIQGGFSRESFKDLLENCLGFLKDFPDLAMGPGHGIWQWDLTMGPGDGS